MDIFLGNNLLRNVDWLAVCDTNRWTGLYLNDNQITDISGFSHKNSNWAELWTLNLYNNQIKNFSITAKFPKVA